MKSNELHQNEHRVLLFQQVQVHPAEAHVQSGPQYRRLAISHGSEVNFHRAWGVQVRSVRTAIEWWNKGRSLNWFNDPHSSIDPSYACPSRIPLRPLPSLKRLGWAGTRDRHDGCATGSEQSVTSMTGPRWMFLIHSILLGRSSLRPSFCLDAVITRVPIQSHGCPLKQALSSRESSDRFLHVVGHLETHGPSAPVIN